jgi:hypothetical protein
MYPAFMSFKSLDSGDAAGTGYWLTYWIVWSCMTVLEVFEAVALYIPFYYELKLALVIWLIHPQSKGAEVCFKQFVQPLLKKHEKDIDDGLTHLQVLESIAWTVLTVPPVPTSSHQRSTQLGRACLQERTGEQLSILRQKAEAAGFEFPTWDGPAGVGVGGDGGLRQRGGGGAGGGGDVVAADPADPEAGHSAPKESNKDDD